MEDLQSTTRYVTWSLHTKSRSSLKSMLSKVTTGGPGGSGSGGGGGHQHGGKGGGAGGASEAGGATADFLENTLWNRTLGAMSEEIVAALVCQIFEGEPEWVRLVHAAQRSRYQPGGCCLKLMGCGGSKSRTCGGAEERSTLNPALRLFLLLLLAPVCRHPRPLCTVCGAQVQLLLPDAHHRHLPHPPAGGAGVGLR
jgi:hypothetical protein